MKMKTLLLSVVAATVTTTGLAATEYFVDCNRPDDSGGGNNGTTEITAFRTISAALSHASTDGGDTITVLPGHYGDAQGTAGTQNGQTTRLLINKNVKLRSRDGASSTFIVGKRGAAANGMGTDGVRCIVAMTACTIQGFTICDGASANVSTAGGYGGGIHAAGQTVTVMDCVISNCVATRGGGVYQGTYIRCRFDGNAASTYGAAMRDAAAFNCLFTHNGTSKGSTSNVGVIAYPKAIVNCTLANNSDYGIVQMQADVGRIINSVLLHNGKGAGTANTSNTTTWQNCILDNSYIRGQGANCVLVTTDVEFFSPASGDYRLLPTASCVNAGSLDAARTYFADYIDGKDLGGSQFCADGDHVSVGAFQETITPEYGRIIVEVPSSSDGTIAVNGHGIASALSFRSTTWPTSAHVTFSPVAGRGLIGFSRSDTGEVDWPTMNDDVYLLLPKAGDCTATIHVGSVKYVDAANEGDANADGTAEHPYSAINDVTVGQSENMIVMVADGEYKKGEYFAGDVTNRIWVNNAQWTRIRSQNGAARTFIFGAADTGSGNDNGTGAAAVRCAYLGGHTQLQGFTLLDGHTRISASDGNLARGGGVFVDVRNVDAKLVGVTDCVISNCVGSRGAAVFGGTLERCLITKNYATVSGVTRNCKLCTSVIADNNDKLNKDVIGLLCQTYQCTVAGNTTTKGSVTLQVGGDNSVVASVIAGTSGSKDYIGTSPSLTNSVIGTVEGTAVSTETCAIVDPMFSDLAEGDYRVCVPSAAVKFGESDNLVRALDFTGKPYRLTSDGKFTVGAFSDLVAGITACSVGVADGGISPAGFQKRMESAMVEYTATKTAERGFLGFEVNGRLIADDGTGRISIAFNPAMESGEAAWMTVKAVYSTNWYVDERNGSDSNTGFTSASAKKTLAAAAALMTSGDTLMVAPGYYSDGTMLQTITTSGIGDYTPTVRARLVLSNGCSAVATEGPEVTFIVGAADSTGDANGMGPNAIRGVFLYPDTRISGFTITGGHTEVTGKESVNVCGGGICGYDASSLVENCIVSNNVSIRCGGMRYGTARNCRFLRNLATGNSSCIRDVDAYQCYFDDNRGAPLLVNSSLYNCTVGSGNKTANGYRLEYVSWTLVAGYRFVNTLFAVGSDIQCNFMTNCAYLAGATIHTYDATKQAETVNVNPVVGDSMLDSEGAPQYGSVAIDAGDASLLSAECADLDLAGVQRIYNNALDIGCFEYDMRDRYAAKLRPRGVTVQEASPAVEEIAGGVLIREGCLSALWRTQGTSGRFKINCSVTGGGTLTVKRNGVVLAQLTSASGAQSLVFECDSPENHLAFKYDPANADVGGAVIAGLSREVGTMIVVQ